MQFQSLIPQIKSIDESTAKGLARSYKTIDYPSNLRSILKFIYPETDFTPFKKHELHQVINATLLKNYNGEQVLKYLLVKEFLAKKVTAALEIKVNNSRADFVTINGDTKCFEIKSDIDNLNKLPKQVADYIHVFEYNFVVISERHLKAAQDIVPEQFGIWIFKGAQKKVFRDAKLNIHLNPESQLLLFTKRELLLFFKSIDFSEILRTWGAEQVNVIFKQMLKKRYDNKWNFLKSHSSQILPIDFHFFFHNNLSPQLVYNHC